MAETIGDHCKEERPALVAASVAELRERLHLDRMPDMRCFRLAAFTAAALGLTAAAHAQRPASAVGIWATEGYGLVFDVRADSVVRFEVTKVSCIPVFRAATAPPPAGALAAFGPPNAPASNTVLPGRTANDARIHRPSAASDMIVRRIDRKPATCDTPTPDTPISNFDVFAQTWAEQYPFFAERKTDWAAVVAANRPRVTDSTTPEQLFDVISGMIAPFDDAHTSIRATTIQKGFGGIRKSPSFLATPAERDSGYALVSAHLTSPLHSFCEGRVEFGMLAPDVGYLRIRGFGGYTKDGTYESGLVALEAALDTALANSSGWKGLVIDVRINGGGADPYGIAIARRLTATPYTAYSKQARSDPADQTKWSAEQPSIVQPTTRPSFRGPVVELIGVMSISAAETFTQALLNRQPKITRVGETTQGVFSDVLGRQLPNGWRFGLPNERFVTNGKTYDLIGIAPDVAVESFTPAARATGRDAGVEKAVELLRGGRSGRSDQAAATDARWLEAKSAHYTVFYRSGFERDVERTREWFDGALAAETRPNSPEQLFARFQKWLDEAPSQ